MSNLADGAVTSVTLPYSVKTIGDGAFYASGIGQYIFESITAPVLLQSYFDNGLSGFNSLYYSNFEDLFYVHSTMVTPSTESTLIIYYPENGTGYDNYVYTYYFGTAIVTAEIIDDTTRSVKQMIEGFVSADEVSSWNSLEVNATNKAMVEEFSANVKEAHRLYNTITSEVQLGFLGEDNITKLTDIEKQLKSVKSKFGITVTPSSLAVSSNSTHKNKYVEGEKFDLSGLKLVVTYDDYSTEEMDESAITLTSRYDVELTSLNRYVVVECLGKTVQVAITVTEEEDDTTTPPDDTNTPDTPTTPDTPAKSGCGSMDSGDGMNVMFIVGAAALAVVAIKLVKRRKNGEV
jgi:hypothetical protein